MINNNINQLLKGHKRVRLHSKHHTKQQCPYCYEADKTHKLHIFKHSKALSSHLRSQHSLSAYEFRMIRNLARIWEKGNQEESFLCFLLDLEVLV